MADRTATSSTVTGRADKLEALESRVAAAETALADAKGDLKRAGKRIERLEGEIAAVRSALNLKSRTGEEG